MALFFTRCLCVFSHGAFRGVAGGRPVEVQEGRDEAVSCLQPGGTLEIDDLDNDPIVQLSLSGEARSSGATVDVVNDDERRHHRQVSLMQQISLAAQQVASAASPARVHEVPLPVLLESDGDATDEDATHVQTGMHVVDDKAWQPITSGLGHRGEMYRRNLGIKLNGYGDCAAFMTAVVVGLGAFVVCVIMFSFLRVQYPMVYSHNCIGENARFSYKCKEWETNFFGWCPAVNDIFRTQNGCGLFGRLVHWNEGSVESFPFDAETAAGLDHAMLLFYCQMCSKILLVLAIPSIFIVMPTNAFLGGGGAGEDRLSMLGFANVVDDSWLMWCYSLAVWFVVAVVHYYIFEAQAVFIKRRQEWLTNLPYPQCNTVLVQQIPEDYCSDKGLAQFFNDAFEEEVVDKCYVLRKCSKLEACTIALETYQARLKAAEASCEKSGQRQMHVSLTKARRVDSIEEYTEEMAKSQEALDKEQARIDAAIASSASDPSVFWATGLVTFKKRQTAELALKQNFTEDLDEFVISTPPHPSSIEYKVFCVDTHVEAGGEAVSNLAMLGIFFAFLPIVVCVSSLVKLDYLRNTIPLFNTLVKHYPVVTTMWDGIMGPAALTGLMGFVPTFLVVAMQSCKFEKSPAWQQHKIQNWYFMFLIIFVLLVTAIGTSLLSIAKDIWQNPSAIFNRLALSMPTSTHFYLKYLPAQWTGYALVLTRWMPLFKFLGFQKIVASDERAKELSEPEDQDWYGIGARSARLELYMVIAITFCSLTPLITVVGSMTFYIARIVYGYLFVFAETKKEDLGGIFWCTSLKHTQLGVFVYVVMMSSVLFERCTHNGPGIIALSALLPAYYFYVRLDRAFKWEYLPFTKLKVEHRRQEGKYEQPELQKDPEPQKEY